MEHSPEKIAASQSSNSTTSTSPASKSEEIVWVLRPLWQRAALASAYMAMVLASGAVLFTQRARYVHRLHLVVQPKPSRGFGSVKGRSLFFQTCHNGRMEGHVVPLGHCKIMVVSEDKTSVILKVEGTRGAFNIGTAGAKIDGNDAPPFQVFAELVKRGIPHEKLDLRKRR